MSTIVHGISSETSDIIYKFIVYETTSEFIQFGGVFMKRILEARWLLKKYFTVKD